MKAEFPSLAGSDVRAFWVLVWKALVYRYKII